MPAATRHIRFGPFELDPHSGELYKSGQKLKISGKPVQILTTLLNQPGELISREELRRQLWPADTFVDFENGLNTAVKKLRQALGDEADAPRYVETLPRHGYRFIGQILSTEAQTKIVATNTRAQEVSIPGPEPALGPANEAADHRSTEKGKHLWWRFSGVWIGAAVVLVAVGLSVVTNVGGLRHRLLRLTNPASIQPRDPIVLADFVNTTGDPVFDDTLKQGLFVQLSQSPVFNIVPEQRVRRTLEQMRRNPGEPLTAELAWEVCQRTNSQAVLGGTIAGMGSQYVIGLTALSCSNGDSLAQVQLQAGNKEEVLKVLGKGAIEFRKKLGESLASIQKFDTPIDEATTSSLEALQAYSRGFKARWAQDDSAALPFFQRAIDLDPDFAMAYLEVGLSRTNLAETETATPYFERAYALRERVSERERCTISAYYGEETGSIVRQISAWSACERAFPHDFVPHQSLGRIYSWLGQYEKAIPELREAIAAEPTDSYNYAMLMDGLLSLNRFQETNTVYQQALERRADNVSVHVCRYELAFLERDSGEMDRQMAWAEGKPGAEEILLMNQAEREAFSGHLNQAREFSRRAVESASRAGEKHIAARIELIAALREAEFGNRSQSQQNTAAALKFASTRRIRIEAALTLARAGQLAQAQALADKLAGESASDIVLNNLYWLPVMRAAIELDRKQATKALELLQTADTYNIYAAYLRGQAYILMHDGLNAATEFQRVRDHSGRVRNSPWGALIPIGLGRAYVLQGDTAKARAAYEDFLTLWKDADPDIPILREARAEYDKLK